MQNARTKWLNTVWHDLQNCIHENPPKWQFTRLSFKIENKSEVVVGYIHYLWIYVSTSNLNFHLKLIQLVTFFQSFIIRSSTKIVGFAIDDII